MQQRLLLSTALVLLVAGCRPKADLVRTSADPATTLSQQSVDAVLYQYASAEVHRLYQQGYELARIKLDANLAQPRELPPAVVVDVDETVLDNSPYQAMLAREGRTYSADTWTAWCNKANARALPGAVDFLKYAASKGCTVFYITNRLPAEKDGTVRNLVKEGFPFADAEHVMVMEGTSDKTVRRAAVSAKHAVVLFIGDQLTDIDQSFKDRKEGEGKPFVDRSNEMLSRSFVLLPNPMYGTWLDAIGGRPDSVKAGNKECYLRNVPY